MESRELSAPEQLTSVIHNLSSRLHEMEYVLSNTQSRVLEMQSSVHRLVQKISAAEEKYHVESSEENLVEIPSSESVRMENALPFLDALKIASDLEPNSDEQLLWSPNSMSDVSSSSSFSSSLMNYPRLRLAEIVSGAEIEQIMSLAQSIVDLEPEERLPRLYSTYLSDVRTTAEVSEYFAMFSGCVSIEDMEALYGKPLPDLSRFSSQKGRFIFVPPDAGSTLPFLFGIQAGDVIRVIDEGSGSHIAQVMYHVARGAQSRLALKNITVLEPHGTSFGFDPPMRSYAVDNAEDEYSPLDLETTDEWKNVFGEDKYARFGELHAIQNGLELSVSDSGETRRNRIADNRTTMRLHMTMRFFATKEMFPRRDVFICFGHSLPSVLRRIVDHSHAPFDQIVVVAVPWRNHEYFIPPSSSSDSLTERAYLIALFSKLASIFVPTQ